MACLFFALLLGAGGCGIALYQPTDVHATRAGVPLTELQQGRSLYADRCSSCHNLRLPEKYSPEKWSEELGKMQRKAKISDDEKRLIFQYLTAAGEGRDKTGSRKDAKTQSD